jgi:hypothetical protein
VTSTSQCKHISYGTSFVFVYSLTLSMKSVNLSVFQMKTLWPLSDRANSVGPHLQVAAPSADMPESVQCRTPHCRPCKI